MSLLLPTIEEEILAALNDDKRFGLAARFQRHLRLQRQHRPVVTFSWIDTRTFEIDGQVVHATGRALPLAWLLLANHFLRVGKLRPEYFFQQHAKPSRNASQALGDAEQAVRPYSPTLAGCIKTLGTAGGVLVPKAPMPGIVVCRSALLERLAA